MVQDGEIVKVRKNGSRTRPVLSKHTRKPFGFSRLGVSGEGTCVGKCLES